jgi:hypothetical protein
MKITEFRDIATQTFSHALAKRENLPEKQNNFLPSPAPIASLFQRQREEKWKQQRGPSEGKKRVRRRKESSTTGAGLHSAKALSLARLEVQRNDATDPLGAEPTRMENPEYRFSSIRVLFWGVLFEGEARRRWRGREDFSR